MKTIKDIDWKEWSDLDWEERLDITINTLFVKNKINETLLMYVGDFGAKAKIQLCCVEEDEKEAITEGWINIKEDSGARTEINLWRGNGQPYFSDADMIWSTIFYFLESLEE